MNPRQPRLLYLVTHPMTARLLLRGQIEWMQQRGFEVTVITSTVDEPAAPEDASYEVRRVPMAREIAPFRDLLSLVRLVREMRRIRPDVVNASTPKAGLLGALAARLAGVPVRIYTLRGLRLETATGWRRRVLTAAERLACASVHRVLCVSESLRRRCLELDLCAPEKMIVPAAGSSNGVDVERFAEVSAASTEGLRTELGLYGGPVIGFVGRITHDKGIEDLRTIFESTERALPGSHLLLIGGAEPGDPVSAATGRWIADHPRVLDLGQVDDPAPYYSLMDVLAFPSKREGLPNAPLEAAAAGVPTVGYRVTGTVDAVEHGVSGTLVDAGDVEGLASSLLGYLEEPELRRLHGRAARHRVAERYGRERVWDAFATEYRRLLDEASEVEPAPGRSPYRRFGKRALDLTLSSIALLIGLPLLLTVALLVRMRLGRPVLYRQRRPGRDGKPFTLLKFRTMTGATDERGEPLPDEQRLTRFGRALRRWSLDELPELINVLRGDMSLVGPRPLLEEYLERYDREQARRHQVRPGITGWAQINGRNAISWPRRLELDVWYVDRVSLALDLGILATTCRKIVTGEGVTAAGHATMPKFRGASGDST